MSPATVIVNVDEGVMHTVGSISEFLEAYAPPSLAEDWDNVGLLVGDPGQTVQRVMTCLTITPESADEAIADGVNMIVTHHPLPFRPLRRLTTKSHEGRLLWQLMSRGVAIYSPHTAFDSCRRGINRQLAEGIALRDVHPLVPVENESNNGADVDVTMGGGRHGTLDAPLELAALAGRLKAFLAVDRVQLVGEPTRALRRVAVACGSAGTFLQPAIAAGCEALVTGEVSFHTCLEAQAAGVALILLGHYASERFAVAGLADVLAEAFPELSVWASRHEQNPLQWC
ncbi:MAG: Nif3-like dinuclear metal center hexameric protein [Pirellulales bacterium]